MSFLDIHIADTKKLINDGCEEIHRWIDEMATVFPPRVWLEYHRSFRHNSYGFACCRAFWGKRGELAFKIHIVRDKRISGIVDLDLVEKKFAKTLLYYNDLDNLEVQFFPGMFTAWEKTGRSLIALALGEEVEAYRESVIPPYQHI